ncbi:hypothetical protein GUITHDRAFT_146112 [Guillardia theta CCMP2712]|uniref:HIG1 domain-containing protein n=1 Tax=Guillardia theta (strain CCMP2712) TaxID=905079 RepID=L1IIA3_GUITC|nr:hypothetical protein GUITHDRAFT_146112 [Guillardia theta CCMP2712]EKX35956.1 hypothetical protein GUITHDRAFT_146112 [Guillardia theta CCMP2712]|eukprot:XP_005822936.1 hypothetical protein GUITHDRAFT_146112 [Guillardia theta CCMP2712]
MAVQGKKERTPQVKPVVPSAKEGVQVSELDAFMFKYFGKDSPIIPLGVFTTAIILGSGLVSFNSGDKATSQTFMRARVIAQGITVAAMMASLGVQERQRSLGLL